MAFWLSTRKSCEVESFGALLMILMYWASLCRISAYLRLDTIACIAVQPSVLWLSSTHFATGRVLMTLNHPITCQSPQHLH
jgi:hypothetical protein